MLEPINKNEEKPRVTQQQDPDSASGTKDFVNFGLLPMLRVKATAVKRAPTTPKPRSVHRAPAESHTCAAKACSRKRKLETPTTLREDKICTASSKRR
jgi:hypothetical protein